MPARIPPRRAVPAAGPAVLPASSLPAGAHSPRLSRLHVLGGSSRGREPAALGGARRSLPARCSGAERRPAAPPARLSCWEWRWANPPLPVTHRRLAAPTEAPTRRPPSGTARTLRGQADGHRPGAGAQASLELPHPEGDRDQQRGTSGTAGGGGPRVGAGPWPRGSPPSLQPPFPSGGRAQQVGKARAPVPGEEVTHPFRVPGCDLRTARPG